MRESVRLSTQPHPRATAWRRPVVCAYSVLVVTAVKGLLLMAEREREGRRIKCFLASMGGGRVVGRGRIAALR